MSTQHVDTTNYQAVSKQQNNIGNPIYMELESLGYPKATTEIAQITASNSLGAFNGVSYQTFELSSDRIHVIKKFILQLDVENSSATLAVSPVVSPWLFDRIELLSDSSTLSTLYPYQLYSEYLLDNSQEWITNVSSDINISPSTYDGNNTIAPSGTARFYIPFSFFINDTAFMPAVLSRLRIKTYWNNSVVNNGSGGAMTISDCVLLSYGDVYDSKIRDALLQRYRSYDHVWKSTDRRDSSISLGVISSNVAITKLMSSLTGSFSNIRMSLRDSSFTHGNLYNFEDISNITILDSSSQPVNYQNIPSRLLRTVLRSEMGYPSQSSATKEIYDYPLSMDPWATEKCGKLSGRQIFNGRYQVKLTPGVLTNSGTAHDLLMYGTQYVELTLKKSGELVVQYL